jgi:hypothetical protein
VARFVFLAALCLPFCSAQSSGVLTVTDPPKVKARRGAPLEVKTALKLQSGYHVNSNTPSETYLIPLRLTWEPGRLETVDVVFPKPTMEKYEFSASPLSVFTGNFELVTRFKVSQTAPTGPGVVLGKLRYQACNFNSCLPPKTLEIKLPVVIQ